MGAGKSLRKILIILFWVATGIGLITLLVAAIGKKNRGMSTGLNITINEGSGSLFLDEKDIAGMLNPVLGKDLETKNASEINLHRYEKLLRDHVWISRAELWFDKRNKLHVSVYEKRPLARIFARNGSSFYIDSMNTVIPVSHKKAIRLPVFTGFPGERLKTKDDSILMNTISHIATYLHQHEFWLSQVSQVHVNEEGAFEMIPVVGDHIVKLGDGSDIEKKFYRLMIFYRQVLRQSGFNRYSMINVQYSGQVIAARNKQPSNQIDLEGLKNNVDKLLKKTVQTVSSGLNDEPSSVPAGQQDKQGEEINNESGSGKESNIPNSVKTLSLPTKEQNKEVEKVPKAVMPKRDTVNQEQ